MNNFFINVGKDLAKEGGNMWLPWQQKQLQLE